MQRLNGHFPCANSVVAKICRAVRGVRMMLRAGGRLLAPSLRGRGVDN